MALSLQQLEKMPISEYMMNKPNRFQKFAKRLIGIMLAMTTEFLRSNLLTTILLFQEVGIQLFMYGMSDKPKVSNIFMGPIFQDNHLIFKMEK